MEEQNPVTPSPTTPPDDDVRRSMLRNSSLAALGSLLLAVLLWFGVFAPKPALVKARQERLSRQGADVFRQEGCWYCHHPELKGTRWGPTLFRSPSAQRLVAYLHNPQKIRKGTDTQSHQGLLTRGAGGALVLNARGKALLAYLRAGAEPGVKFGRNSAERFGHDNGIGLPSQGKKLFAQMCAGCHGAKGQGDGVLAKNLTAKVRDLTKPQRFVCRSHSTGPAVRDLLRTVTRGSGGCQMQPAGRLLAGPQLQALTEYLRRISGVAANAPVHHQLSISQPSLPPSRLLLKRKFQSWLASWWRDQYQAWRANQAQRKHRLRRSLPEWRDETEWRRFSAWAAADRRRLRLSKEDWLASFRRRSRFAGLYNKWRETGSILPYMTWLRKRLCRGIQRKKMSKSRRKMELRACYHRAGLRSYREWRLEQEQKVFRSWKNKQEKWMFWAWKGKQAFKAKNCTRCHHIDGRSQTVRVPIQDPRTKKARLTHLDVPALNEKKFRCGAGTHDLYRAVTIPVGQCRKMLRLAPARMPVPAALGGVRLKVQGLAQRHEPTDWHLVAYLRFLSRTLPIAQPTSSR